MKKWLCIAFALILILGVGSGCDDKNPAETSVADDTGTIEETSDTAAVVEISQTDTDMFTDRDYRTDYDEADSVRIQLDGNSAAASSDSVQISGTTVTITEEATYIISGTLDDGMIIVNAPDTAKIQLVLSGVDINSETCAPLYILEADKVFVTLAENSENTLSNGGAFTATSRSISLVCQRKQPNAAEPCR